MILLLESLSITYHLAQSVMAPVHSPLIVHLLLVAMELPNPQALEIWVPISLCRTPLSKIS